MRHHIDIPADELRRLILSRPTVSAARLASVCGITIQQVAGYRAAHTLKAQRQRLASSSPRRAPTPHIPITRHQKPAKPHRSSARRANAAIPQRLIRRLQTARRRAEYSLKGYLTKALRATELIAKTLKLLDSRL